ncbi:MAG: DUF1587 domain-containing protein, partial [Planctomycetota bacterium]
MLSESRIHGVLFIFRLRALRAVLFAASFLGHAVLAAEDWTVAAAFLEQHCQRCHSGEMPAGQLQLPLSIPDFGDADIRARWIHVYDRVSGGEMPPETKPVPEWREQFLRSLESLITAGEARQPGDALRRLNREEYQYTVCDLFGVTVDLRMILPEDGV